MDLSAPVTETEKAMTPLCGRRESKGEMRSRVKISTPVDHLEGVKGRWSLTYEPEESLANFLQVSSISLFQYSWHVDAAYGKARGRGGGRLENKTIRDMESKEARNTTVF
jgi:hypothetical protein